MPGLSWIDALWRRIQALIQRIVGPRPAALTATRELSREAGPQAATLALATEAAEPSGARPVVAEGSAQAAATPAVVVAAGSGSAEAAATSAMEAASAVTGLAANAAPPVVVAAASGEVAGLRGSGVQAGARPAMSVRRYFGRLVAATPAGLTIDFTRWQTASVERYFLAITSPGLIRRREAATTGAEVVHLPNAFEGFEWD